MVNIRKNIRGRGEKSEKETDRLTYETGHNLTNSRIFELLKPDI
jgi:hypothetical protein